VALQQLITVCEKYGKDNYIIYNNKKTVCMAILTNILKKFTVPSVFLNGNKLNYVNDYKYLGVYISSDKSDTLDMKRQLRYIYCKGNMLAGRFSKCSEDIKCQLFKSYCYNLYCAHLWSNYPEAKLQNVKVAYNNVFRHFF
jgi:hypothetical protein